MAVKRADRGAQLALRVLMDYARSAADACNERDGGYAMGRWTAFMEMHRYVATLLRGRPKKGKKR